MKLLKLWIEDYKNLKNFTIDFSSHNGFTMLIGNNGSGKSNILEVISGIFADAYKIGRLKILNDYILEYSIGNSVVNISKKFGKRYFRFNGILISRDVFIRERYLPSNVIGVYSGEEDRLWVGFYEAYYREYIQRIIENQPQENMKLMFINKYYWNIALLTMLISTNDLLRPFIENEIRVSLESDIKVKIEYNIYKLRISKNELLKSFIKSINEKSTYSVEYTLNDLSIKARNNRTDNEIFWLFAQAFLPKKDKIITNIKLKFNDQLSTESLSEGEKKLILIKGIIEFLTDEKTLLLLDEPDSHIHEGRKKQLFNILKEYSENGIDNRQVVLTSHSPTLVQMADQENVIMLEDNGGNASQIPVNKLEKIKKLTSGVWNVVEQNMIFKSEKPLIIFEGQTDLMFVKRALELLRTDKEEYRKLDIDFLNANGAGNAKAFIDNILEIADPSKKIVIFFDRDDGGREGAAKVAGLTKHDQNIVDYRDIPIGNIIVSFIPYKLGIVDGDFLIEDYFPETMIIDLINSAIPQKKHPIRNLPNLNHKIKSELEIRYMSFRKDDFIGYTTLLDKIVMLAR